MYSRETTNFGWSPCHIQLKKSTGRMGIEITVQEVVTVASSIVVQCGEEQGAGWMEIFHGLPWYVLVYGGVRLESPTSSSNTTESSGEVGTA